jgi:hypothetical protein
MLGLMWSTCTSSTTRTLGHHNTNFWVVATYETATSIEKADINLVPSIDEAMLQRLMTIELSFNST